MYWKAEVWWAMDSDGDTPAAARNTVYLFYTAESRSQIYCVQLNKKEGYTLFYTAE